MFDELFCNIPVGTTTFRRWNKAPKALLNSAARKIYVLGANPWVFVADARHFWQFAGTAEKAVLSSLTPAEHQALLGAWSEEDYDPTTFGY